MKEFFGIVVYEPMYNALIFLYSVLWSDLGIAIVALTIIIKVSLLGMSKKQISSQKEMQEIQPLIKKIQAKYKNNKEELAKKTMELYKEHKINPAAGCLPLIIQMVVFITLYRVFLNLLQNDGARVRENLLYSIVPHVNHVNDTAFGFLNLTNPSPVLAVVTAVAQYFQIKMMQNTKKDTTEENKKAKTIKELSKKGQTPSVEDFSTIMSKQMRIFIPIMTLVVGFSFPAGLTLYWFVSTVFMIIQQWFIMKNKS